MPLAHGRRLAALFPQGSYLEIPGSGTLIPEDQPDALAAAIDAFIDESTDKSTDESTDKNIDTGDKG